MKPLLLILFCFASAANSFSQYDKNTWKQPDTLNRVKPVLTFDSRFSVLRGIGASFSGIKAGVQFARKWRVGVGYYFTNALVEVTDQFSNQFPDDTLLERSKLAYGTVYGEYLVFKRVRWEISLPLHFGFGYGSTQFFEQNSGKYLGKNRDFIVLTEFSPIVSFRFCRWMGIGSGLGFRAIFNSNKELEEAYNAVIFILRARFYINELFMVVKTAVQKKRAKKSR